jgi:hypothetical protein
MGFWWGFVSGISVGILANLVTPRLTTYLIRIRNRIFLNHVYYLPQIQMRTISDIEQVSLASKTVKLMPDKTAQDIYSLQFLISCTRSEKLAEYLTKHEFWIELTFTGIDSVKFYPIDLNTKLPDYNNPKDIIEFSSKEFKTPRDRFYSAVILSPSNDGNFTIGFNYSLKKNNSSTKKSKVNRYMVIFKNITTFDSVNLDYVNCEKIRA